MLPLVCRAESGASARKWARKDVCMAAIGSRKRVSLQSLRRRAPRRAHLTCSSQAGSYGASTGENRPAHLKEDADREGSTLLGPRFHWDMRTTGVTPDWQAYYGRWTHYNPRTLEVERSGRIRKTLKMEDEDTFWLMNTFEVADPVTQDGMASGFRLFMQTRPDGHQFTKYPFIYTPGRAFNQSDDAFLWTGTPMDLPPAIKEDPYHNLSKAMLLRPRAATWAGNLYVPPAEVVVAAQSAGGGKLSAYSAAELWLGQDEEEEVKLGVLLGYNTVSGELAVLFRCHERRPDGSPVVEDPDAPFSFDEVAPAVVNSTEGTGLPRDPKNSFPSFAEFVSQRGLRGDASVLLLEQDPSAASGAEGAGYRETWWEHVSLGPEEAWSPADGDSRYLHLQFDDGLYLNIPRSLAEFGDEEFVFEVGAVMAHGNAAAPDVSEGELAPKAVHRILSIANRSKGGHHILAYEKFA